jgi:hypothetical protein
MNAVSGIEIQNPSAIIREEFRTEAFRIANVHAQYVEEFHPLRVDESFVWQRIRDASGLQHELPPATREYVIVDKV